MKLATYRDGSRDGQLLVVSRDLCTAHYAVGIATRLQQVLDDWNFLSPQLEDLSITLNQGKARHAFSFDPARCLAPLPRAYQWAYALDVPALQVAPALNRSAGDELAGACDDIVLTDATAAVGFEARLAAVTGDVPQGASPLTALEGIRLLMLANTACLPPGADPVTAHLGSAFSPVAVTPDELGAAWQGGRVQLDLQRMRRGRRAEACQAAALHFHFGELIAHLAQSRPVGAGSIVGTAPLAMHHGVGDTTPAFAAGDALRLQMKGADGQCVFGIIDQHVRAKD